MLDWVLCRIKAGLMLILFFLPIAASLWHQRELARMEAITRTEPILPLTYYVDADDPSELPLDLP